MMLNEETTLEVIDQQLRKMSKLDADIDSVRRDRGGRYSIELDRRQFEVNSIRSELLRKKRELLKDSN